MPTVFVTGGGRGIGRAIALAFAEPGSTVAIASRTRSELQETGAAIEKRGAKALILTTDVTDESSVAAAFKVVNDAGHNLDVVINNAGVGGGKPIDETDTASWRRILDTNVWGTFLVTRQAVPLLS